MSVLFNILIFLVGYIVGVMTIALFSISSIEDDINEAYQLGYERGKAESEEV